MESKARVHDPVLPPKSYRPPAERASGLHDSRRGVRILILVVSGHGFETNERGYLVRSGQTHFQRSLGLFVSGRRSGTSGNSLPIRQLLRKGLGWCSWDCADCVPGREVGKGGVFEILDRSLNDAQVFCFRRGHLLG